MNASQFRDQLVTMISQDRPAVAREAAESSFAFDPGRLEELWLAAMRNPHRALRLLMFKLLAKARKWAQFRFYLEALGDPDENVSARAVIQIGRWSQAINRISANPSSSESAAIRRLFEERRSRLPARLEKELAFVVRTSL